MDFMKVFDQTVREIKREVNLKVLKVPEMEQKVLDATDEQPWGPHGSALAEIAQGTKKYSECQIVMNVLWTRLTETGRNWRYVYKALTVIEYLVSHGSERAVDDIIEHTYQISSLSSFEYVEPSGKDMGINVRKKAENIVALLNDKDKIQEVRNKAASNRDKYVGLSSSGITYKSGAPSFGSSSFESSNKYGGFGSTNDGDTSKDKEKNHYGEDMVDRTTYSKSHKGDTRDNKGSFSKRGSTRQSSKAQDSSASGASKPVAVSGISDNYTSVTSKNSAATSNNYDDFDDFDPRGTASQKPATGNSKQVDLFGESLLGDLMDTPISVTQESPTVVAEEVDLFADATFISTPPLPEVGGSSQNRMPVDLFASQSVTSTKIPTLFAPQSVTSTKIPTLFAPQSVTSTKIPPPAADLFAVHEAVVEQSEKSKAKPSSEATIFDPFSAVPLNNFDGSDPFGPLSSHTDSVSVESRKNDDNLTGKPSTELKGSSNKDTFQVKSGIWADSLSRGLIDLNISAPKKVSLADVGVVGGLSDGSDETSFYMSGRAIGSGSSGPGKSGFTPMSGLSGGGIDDDNFFSSLSIGGQQYPPYGGSHMK
ncbi:clathrin interactor EPSIN 1 [Impatiens glandulifera]|uniref:clathrin interactor EPSIN 1 n=1 Tax=Impatiens glandulifera TaxID=253017 RepID=UPI001FB0D621|nr:clathrin interactor EPSIN 1 [Impatiens glandulifera]